MTPEQERQKARIQAIIAAQERIQAQFAAALKRQKAPHPDITFERGTIGRIIVLRGLQYHRGPTEPNPMHSSVRLYQVILTDRDGREFVTPFRGSTLSEPDSIEQVLDALAEEALYFERADGNLENYAEMLGGDPRDPVLQQTFESVRKYTAEFRAFLGEKAFEQLLEIVNERQ